MQLLPLPLRHQSDTLQHPTLIYCWGWHSDSTLSLLLSLLLPHTHFLSLTMATAGSITPYPCWLCIVLNKALCSRQVHCIEFCISYRTATDKLLSRGLIGWSWEDSTIAREDGEECCWSWKIKMLHACTYPPVQKDTQIMTIAELTWSNCASSPLWSDRDRGFSCEGANRHTTKRERARTGLSLILETCWYLHNNKLMSVMSAEQMMTKLVT